MPIFDQGYQHWNGKLGGHAWRWFAITRQGVITVSKLKAVRAVVILAWTPALLLAIFLSIWGLIEQKSALLTAFGNLLQALPEEIQGGPKDFRKTIWTLAYYNFFGLEIYFSLLIVALVGPNLISQDLRFNAMPLYFSKPLRRIDYFIGKLGVIATFIAAVSIFPAILAYALGVSFSLDATVVRDTWRILVASIAFGSVVSLSAGALMLAISSLSKNSRYVAAIWMGIWIVGGVTGTILTDTVRRPWCPLTSYQRNLELVRNGLLDTADARNRVVGLMESSERKVRETMQSMGPFGRRQPFARRASNLPPPPPAEDDDNPFSIRNRKIPMVPDRETVPWTWAAGVLAGLFAVSVWILTTRVKSLDRLR